MLSRHLEDAEPLDADDPFRPRRPRAQVIDTSRPGNEIKKSASARLPDWRKPESAEPSAQPAVENAPAPIPNYGEFFS